MRTFQQLLEAAGYECEAYSGPGMGGTKCLAFTTVDPVKLGHVFADVLGALTEENDDDETEATCKAFRRMRIGALGIGNVVYFPGVEYES